MDLGDKTKIEWSSHLEKYFAELGEKSFCYAYLHKKAEAQFSYYRNFIDLPVIVLSTALGTLSIGGQTLFGEQEQTASVCVGIGSIFVGVLSTIGTYFSFAKRAENHRLTHIEYSKLYRFLQIELALPIKERMRANDLLKVSRENYERLQEVAPLVPSKILEDFKTKFNVEKYKDIAKPSECNGLEKIEIRGHPVSPDAEAEAELVIRGHPVSPELVIRGHPVSPELVIHSNSACGRGLKGSIPLSSVKSVLNEIGGHGAEAGADEGLHGAEAGRGHPVSPEAGAELGLNNVV